tara:strand:+ start:368 stop:724 length:357 start_codon:yes stop_codon:yes gene_type:complete
MKSTELKTLIKTAVREAIQEELKDILLEAVKTPQVLQHPTHQPIIENVLNTNSITPPMGMSAEDKRNAYKNILGDTAASLNSSNVHHGFQPQAGFDSSNGTLPGGEVDMSQISQLMKK